MENGEDFSQDITTDQSFQNEDVNGQQNGGGDGPLNDNGSADTPGKDDDRKLFVGGLSWETTHKELREHFGQYGEIESINVKTDSNTGRSRGFAFIVFNNAESIDKVIAVSEHVINNKKVDPKKAKARHGKIFVGGLTPELTDDDIRNYFGQFGTILEVEMPFDKANNQRKGFCFITFESEQVTNELLKNPKQTIKDRQVDVKRATPKADQMWGGRGTYRGRGQGGSYPGYNNYGYGQGGYGQGYGYGYDGYGYDYYGSGYGGYDYSSYGNYDQSYDDYNRGYRGRNDGNRGKGGGYPGQGGGKQRGGGGGGARNQRHQPY